MYYIQESDKPKFWQNLFQIITLKEDKIILPIGEEELTEKKAKKLAEKTKKIIDKVSSKNIVISKKIKKQKQYINYLQSENINIIERKKLFQILVVPVLDYIVKKKKLKKGDTYVSILINETSEVILENIRRIIRQFKKVNIVTNHIEKFKKLEEQILEQEGIMINVSNNKRKSLSKSKIIINVDFPTELINKYQINEDAIIINLRGNVKINKKRFNGLNINDYEIESKNYEEFDYEKENLYYKKDIYESQLYLNQPLEYIERKIAKDKVKILYLEGNKSKLWKWEKGGQFSIFSKIILYS